MGHKNTSRGERVEPFKASLGPNLDAWVFECRGEGAVGFFDKFIYLFNFFNFYKSFVFSEFTYVECV